LLLTLQVLSSNWDDLTEAADQFEQWALGTLDQMDNAEEAADLITAAPTMRETGSRPDSVAGRVTLLWPGSVSTAERNQRDHRPRG
jgi:hypothetical protein